jgi:hypothetical protein
MILTIQYLEDGPGLRDIAPAGAAARLREAFARLPLTHVLLGWNLPDPVTDASRKETARAGARLYRWHPLLTGDGTLMPRREWQTVGLAGEPVPGFRDMPEFTFLCPNRPPVREAVLAHLHELCRREQYDGVFLDRIRYPSPATDPGRALACFCSDCRRAAAESGLDLDDAQRRIRALLDTPGGRAVALHALLDPAAPTDGNPGLEALGQFLHFRADSVSRFVALVAATIGESGLEVGLDCYSPSLAWSVGQDLGALDAHGAWIKLMSYGHTLGPAGMPFELLALADWSVAAGASERAALAALSSACGLPLPPTRAVLRDRGLSATALAQDLRKGRAAGVNTLLAGIELVDLEGVTALTAPQIRADLRAILDTGVDGLALSWDLLHIPLERLSLVHEAAFDAG